jgi:RNA polymerase sigma-70 factor (ECF subfamily)
VPDRRVPRVRRPRPLTAAAAALESGDSGDRELVDAYLAARDEAAFRALYRHHAPQLWRMALRLARGAEEEAREIVQETWVRAASRLGTFRWESSLRTWLISIALNCAREKARVAGRETSVEYGEGAAAAHRVAEAPTTAPSLGPQSVEPIDLARAIDALPDGYRRVLLLHDLEGYTHDEIGRLLGVEPGTSKSQLHRARARVRARLLAAEGGAR